MKVVGSTVSTDGVGWCLMVHMGLIGHQCRHLLQYNLQGTIAPELGNLSNLRTL